MIALLEMQAKLLEAKKWFGLHWDFALWAGTGALLLLAYLYSSWMVFS